MYENQTREVIEKRMLDRVDPKLDPRIGGVIQTNLASLAIELAKLYEELEYSDLQRTPETANREHMEAWGRQFSITPLEATYAVLKAEIIMKDNRECPIGSRFSQEDLTFVVITKEDGNNYSIQCEQAGEIGNTAFGRIIPIYNIPGLVSATILGSEIPGTNIEGDDQFRERLLQVFSERPYGWNMAMYKQEVSKLQGVGGCKIIRYFEEKDFWVGVYIIDSSYQTPTPELIQKVQETLLPLLPDYKEATIQNSGDGLVAIGHVPIVMGAEEVEINITLHLELDQEVTYPQLEQQIKEKIQDYLSNQCNRNWDDEDHIIIRTSGVETSILEVEGVIDIYDTEINGLKNNVQLEPLQITKLGTVTHEPLEKLRENRRATVNLKTGKVVSVE